MILPILQGAPTEKPAGYLTCRMEVMRSSPMPVSTCLAGRLRSDPSASRLNWMNTLFQISSTLGSSPFTREAASRPPILQAGHMAVHGCQVLLANVIPPYMLRQVIKPASTPPPPECTAS